MSCNDAVCGTGGWNGPLPGDPDNNVTLSATCIYAGIEVHWSYPVTYPEAVAHIQLYRGTATDFTYAVERAVVSGSVFIDPLAVDQDTTYYYWIKIVSVNGTVGSLIGPASATMRPLSEQTLETLTGKIDSGVLATTLASKIGDISLLGHSLTQEVQARLAANLALGDTIMGVDNQLHNALAFITEEVTQRVSGDAALLNSLNLMGVGFDDAIAAIAEEIILKVGPNSALAQKITTLEVSLNGSTATGQVGLIAMLGDAVNKTTGLQNAIGAMYTAKVQVDDLIGGFGIYNNGRTVEAGFDVDRFWVGRTNSSKVKPFIIENDVVYINKARIRNADIDTLKIANNAVTVPASGAMSCTLYMPIAGAVFVTANLSMYESGPGVGGGLVQSAYSMQINCSSGAGAGFINHHSAASRWTSSSTAARFDVPAGYWSFSISYSVIDGSYSVGNANIMAIGTMK